MEHEGKWSAFPRLKEEQEVLLETSEIFTLNLSQSTLDFIIEDDANKLQGILNAMSTEGKKQFLSGSLFQGRTKSRADDTNIVDASDSDSDDYPASCLESKKEGHMRCNLKNPFILAAAYGSQSVLHCMLTNGCDVLQTDTYDYNVIHALIYIAYLQLHVEERANGTLLFLKEQVTKEQFENLLLSENSKGLRPLEMAAHLGTFLIFHTIFETKGVYLTRESVQGIYTTQWFDVTDYESCHPGNRRNKSPLLSLTLVDKCKVGCPHARELLTNSPAGLIMRKWIDIKMACNRPLTLVWFLIRVINAGVFCASMSLSEGLFLLQKKRNNSSLILPENDTNYNMSRSGPQMDIYSEKAYGIPVPVCLLLLIYLSLFSLFSVILDLAEFVRFYYRSDSFILYTPKGKKRLAVHYKGYRIAQFTMSLSIFSVCVLFVVLKGDLTGVPRIIDHIFVIHSMSCIVVSFKYFCQSTACLGPFIITFERMIKHLSCFVLVFLFFVLPYTFVFRHIVCDDDGNDLCKVHFSTVVDAFYTVFTVTLNMVNFATFLGIKYRFELFMVHIQYVFVIVMLLLNFLIAQFTRSLSNTMDNSHIIMPIQRMSLVWPTELRFASIMKTFYSRMHKKYFIPMDGRLYVARTLIVYKPANFKPSAASSKPVSSDVFIRCDPEIYFYK